MANKRISELTSITGANLADADLLVVVDVSDTTMAASGTNKKITMAELAKDSALTDNLVAKSTLTTNGDLLTRAAGEPARITRADLAADSAFTSRYVALANEATRWIDASSLHVTFGSAVIGNPALTNGNGAAWLLDAASTEVIAGSILVPATWATFKIDLYWTNQSSSSGDVVFQAIGNFAGDTEAVEIALASCPLNSQVTVAAPTTASVVKVTQLGGTLTNTPTEPFFFRVGRRGADAPDTLANDAGVYGVLFTKLS